VVPVLHIGAGPDQQQVARAMRRCSLVGLGCGGRVTRDVLMGAVRPAPEMRRKRNVLQRAVSRGRFRAPRRASI